MLEFFNALLSKIFGKKSDKDVAAIKPIVEEINIEFDKLKTLSNDALRGKTMQFRQEIRDYIADEVAEIAALKQKAELDTTEEKEREDCFKEIEEIEKNRRAKIKEKLEELLPQAFAVLKETARRFKENDYLEVTAMDFDKLLAVRKSNVVIENDKAKWANTWNAGGTTIKWDMVHYDVQLIGGIVLHQGKIAEMATGEGKTLVATLPIYLNALPGEGLHVVTVNNYLSRRDCEWNAPLFEFHGLTTDCIDYHQPNSEERRQAYLADITYGTNNEFGFDYLRDNMARSPEELVQRRHNFAIVDEVDSVLIDDARTPLIISGPVPRGDKHEFVELKPKVERLVSAQRSYVQTCLSDAKRLIAEGKKEEGGLALLRAHRGGPKNKALIKYLSETGVKQVLQKTEDYYMADQQKEMPKADAELFFVIDEKTNSIEMTEKGIDLITGNSEDSSFFILPDVGSEIADIEKLSIPDQEKIAAKEKLMLDFSVKSERIHTVNQLLKAYAMFEKDVEYVVIENKVKIVDEQTGRIMEGRRYSDGLHQAIEAKENLRVEDATQTFATITLQNYFRMYEKLSGMTGTAETEAGEFWEIYKLDVVVIPTNRNISRKDMEDLVYKTKREKYNAVIEEVVKLTQAGRPVLVGTTSVEISELLSRMLKLRNIQHNVLNAKLHQREAEVVAMAGKAGAVTIATNMAGRGTDIKLGEGVKDAGGLAIIGTERHESRRVDRQLRGRSGRQGDPGTSQFFVSLEDDLMRMFGSDRIAKLMDRMGHQEGDVIQHSMVTNSIERAQKKVEENNFGIRKRLLEYDDVMNSQREVIYSKRKNALFGDKLAMDISHQMYDVADHIVGEYKELKNYEGFRLELIRVLGIDAPFEENTFLKEDAQSLGEKVYHAAYQHYHDKKEALASRVWPVVKNVYETSGHDFENMLVPITDGIKNMQVLVHLKRAYESQGKEVVKAFEKSVVLAIIDEAWKEHLRAMDELKHDVQGAVYEQKDPLLIYKFEAFKLFKTLLNINNKEIVTFLVKGNLPQQENVPISPPPRIQQQPKERIVASKEEYVSSSTSGPEGGAPPAPAPVQKTSPIKVEPKIGRNDPCPCGSGKKFKQCHGKDVLV
ncbi:MAG: preprotein translocase subunit SecA [Bacteroidia bacterium]|nr:preprotein translocase subunit SecA [Bacteroidia bacterium]